MTQLLKILNSIFWILTPLIMILKEFNGRLVETDYLSTVGYAIPILAISFFIWRFINNKLTK